MTRRLGLLGGTFDPIHRGHVSLATAAERALLLTELLVIPTHVSPHRRQPRTSVFHRFAMIGLTVANRGHWQACDVELRAEGPSYTSITLERFHHRGFRPSEMFFIVGADAFAEIATWRDYPAILDRAHFAVVSRPGLPVAMLPDRLPALAARMVKVPHDQPRTSAETSPCIFLIDESTPDISSTLVRQRCASGASIDDLVEPAVARYIDQHGLYRPPSREGTSASDPLPAAGRLHDIH